MVDYTTSICFWKTEMRVSACVLRYNTSESFENRKLIGNKDLRPKLAPNEAPDNPAQSSSFETFKNLSLPLKI